MKITILLASILAMACTWWWTAYRRPRGAALSRSQRVRAITHSILAGVGTYFALLFAALLYLMATSR